MTSLSKLLKSKGVMVKSKSREPLWKGPSVDGITQSLIGRWLSCKERSRLLTMEGLKAGDRFNHKMEYGNMWHACEEAWAKHQDSDDGYGSDDWQKPLNDHALSLCEKYPLQQGEVLKWHDVCHTQFPLYIDHWSKHPESARRTPLLQEQVFDVPYRLPSGRTVKLRGKWDSVDLVESWADVDGKVWPKGIWLQENKSKGEVNEVQIKRQLRFDLQTMLYRVALGEFYCGASSDDDEVAQQTRRKVADQCKVPSDCVSLLGVRYNVIRRPLSGGKGSIVQGKGTKGSKCPKCKESGKAGGVRCPKCWGKGRIGAKPPETQEEFMGRLKAVIEEDPSQWFMRWTCEVSEAEVLKFRRECLDPVLENILDDFEWWSDCFGIEVNNSAGKRRCSIWDDKMRAIRFPHHQNRHFRLPFGVYNVLAEGGSSELDDYLETGSEQGLQRTTNLFPELT